MAGVLVRRGVGVESQLRARVAERLSGRAGLRTGASGSRVFRQSDRELLSVDDCGDRCSGGLCCAL